MFSSIQYLERSPLNKPDYEKIDLDLRWVTSRRVDGSAAQGVLINTDVYYDI